MARNEPLAGICTDRHARASVVGGDEPPANESFALSPAGLSALAEWLRRRRVRKVALLQGDQAWPWQQEGAPRPTGPPNLADWFAYRGEARIDPEAAWQPVLLALKDEFTIFLVRSRDTPRRLAERLAAGDFLEAYPKAALEGLIDDLAAGRPGALEECLAFFAASTRGHWHNRARAKIARRLKHHDLADGTRRRLVAVIERRLVGGDFTEQFKDQLHLLQHLDPTAAAAAASVASGSAQPHVRRYGEWLAARATPGQD
ncbi:hypothetical protein [Phenylobacterium sp.]|uniref:hypothetical protein n=1 Tax=Phenylobacterium sp. TaxID=1871053 RepID=UPI002ED9F35F